MGNDNINNSNDVNWDDEWKKKNRRYWDDEDWDELSETRRIYRAITGMPLKDDTILFYCVLTVGLIFISIFVN